MAKPVQKRHVKPSKMLASIWWFEVPADDLDRAKKFYGSLFGWTFAKLSAAIADYRHIDTAGKDAPHRTAGSCGVCILDNPSRSSPHYS